MQLMRTGPGMIGRHSHRCDCDACRRGPRPVKTAVDLTFAIGVALLVMVCLAIAARAGWRRPW